MNRHVRLARRTPLTATTGLQRTRMPHRVAGLNPRRVRHMATGRPATRDDLSRQQRDRLWNRSGGNCEGGLVPDCWGWRPRNAGWHACHRYDRARGGDNTALWNRWLGCPPCHRWQTDHSDAAAETGHYVRTGMDPRWLPICLPDGRIVRLDDAGGYEEVAV